MPKFYKNILRIYFHLTASIKIVTIFCFNDYISMNNKLIHFSRLFLLFLNTYRYSLLKVLTDRDKVQMQTYSHWSSHSQLPAFLEFLFVSTIAWNPRRRFPVNPIHTSFFTRTLFTGVQVSSTEREVDAEATVDLNGGKPPVYLLSSLVIFWFV